MIQELNIDSRLSEWQELVTPKNTAQMEMKRRDEIIKAFPTAVMILKALYENESKVIIEP